MDASPIASGANFRICPLCEAERLVFDGLYSARCPACNCEPSGDFLKTLRQIVALSETMQASHSRPNETSDAESGPLEEGR